MQTEPAGAPATSLVECVRPEMTLPAVGVLSVHLAAVRFTVAGLAGRHQAMLVLVAIDAGQVVMFGRVCRERLNHISVAARAPVVWHMIIVFDHSRHVRLVAAQAGLVRHALTVPFVAVQASQPAAMVGMAFRAVELGVQTGIFGQLCPFPAMT